MGFVTAVTIDRRTWRGGGLFAGAAAARDIDFTLKLKLYNKQWRDWLTRETPIACLTIVS